MDGLAIMVVMNERVGGQRLGMQGWGSPGASAYLIKILTMIKLNPALGGSQQVKLGSCVAASPPV